MPTINKTLSVDRSYTDQIITGFADMLGELQNVQKIPDTSGDYSHASRIYFDGEGESYIQLDLTNSGYPRMSIYSGIGKQVCEVYTNFGQQDSIWLREYISINDDKCRLISLGGGPIGQNTVNSQVPFCILTANDVNGNTIYGIGGGGITDLYCLETGIHVDLEPMCLSASFTIASHLSDSAQIAKAINLCHSDLPEIKNVYTAIFRPLFGGNVYNSAAQRYYISGSMWGCVGNNNIKYKCNIFDPMIKI